MEEISFVLIFITLVIGVILLWKYGYDLINILDLIAFICLVFLIIIIIVACLTIINDAQKKGTEMGTVNSGTVVTLSILFAIIYIIFWGLFTLTDKYFSPSVKT